jgi:hypothetical protein
LHDRWVSHPKKCTQRALFASHGTDTWVITVRWVFSRGHEQTIVEVVSVARTYTVSVHHSNGIEQHTTLPSLLEAMRQQAHLERAFTSSGWQLAEFQRPLP